MKRGLDSVGVNLKGEVDIVKIDQLLYIIM
jgi:hypothetical protein